MATSYIVNAPLVVLRDTTGHDLYLYRGTVVPAEVDPEHRQMLIDDGLLVKGKDASDVTPPADGAPPEPDSDDGDGATKPPSKSASKATWVSYATDSARGDQVMTEADADAMTRDQLAEKFASC